MPTATLASNGRVGIALQSVEGTPIANPTHAHDLYSGLPKPEAAINPIEVASLSTVIPGLWKSEQHWVMDMVFPGHPKAYGAWEKAFYGSLVTTGTVPKIHTGTDSNSPPYACVFAERPGGLVERFSDGTVYALNLQYENGQPLKVNVRAMGKTSEVVGALTPASNEVFRQGGPILTCLGATLKFDNAVTPAVTARASIQTATLELNRGLTQEQTNQLTPSFRSLGRFGGGVAMTLLWDSYDLYRQTVYGAAAGSTDSALIVPGSVDFLFPHGPAVDANKSLQRQYPSVMLLMPDPGDIDPGAGPFKVNVSGVIYEPSAGAVVATDILKNDVATY